MASTTDGTDNDEQAQEEYGPFGISDFESDDPAEFFLEAEAQEEVQHERTALSRKVALGTNSQQERFACYMQTAQQAETKHERFALYNKIAKEKHVIHVVRKKVIKNQGVFAKLLCRFPHLRDELDEWYGENKGNKEFDLGKSKYHGIVNAKMTKYTSKCLGSRMDYKKLNSLWIEELFDRWQWKLVQEANGKDPRLSSHLPRKGSESMPWAMETAHFGLKSTDKEVMEAALRHPAAANLTFPILGGVPELQMKVIEKDVGQSGSPSNSTDQSNEAQQYSMQARKRAQRPGQISNTNQELVQDSSHHATKRGRVDCSASPTDNLNQVPAHLQNKSQTSVGGPISGTRSQPKVAMRPPTSVSGQTDQFRTAKQAAAKIHPPGRRDMLPPANDRPLEGSHPARLGSSVLSSTGPIQISAQTSAPLPAISRSGRVSSMSRQAVVQSRDRNWIVVMESGDLANNQPDQIISPPKHGAASPSEGLPSRPINYAIEQSDEIPMRDPATWGHESPNAQMVGEMMDSPYDMMQMNQGGMRRSVSDQTRRTSYAYFQSSTQGDKISLSNNSSQYGQTMQRSESMPTGYLGMAGGHSTRGTPLYPPNMMNSDFRQVSQGSMRSDGYDQSHTLGFRMQSSGVYSPYGQSPSHGNGYTPILTPLKDSFQSPASNTPGIPNTKPPYGGRIKEIVLKELKDAKWDMINRFSLNEEPKRRLREELEGYYKSLFVSLRDNDNTKEAEARNKIDSFVQDLQAKKDEKQQRKQNLLRQRLGGSRQGVSNGIQSMVAQNNLSAQPLAGVHPARVSAMMEIMEKEFKEQIDRYSRSGLEYSNWEMWYLHQLFHAWGYARLKNDDHAAELARHAARSCMPAQASSSRAVVDTSSSLEAAPPPPQNQVRSHALGGLSNDQYIEQPSSGWWAIKH